MSSDSFLVLKHIKPQRGLYNSNDFILTVAIVLHLPPYNPQPYDLENENVRILGRFIKTPFSFPSTCLYCKNILEIPLQIE